MLEPPDASAAIRPAPQRSSPVATGMTVAPAATGGDIAMSGSGSTGIAGIAGILGIAGSLCQ